MFEDAARGMFEIISDIKPQGWEERMDVELAAPDAESLLVDWLSELLYLFEVKKFYTTAPEVELRLTDDAGGGVVLIATVSGIRMKGAISATEIKAVTHHLLSIDKVLGGYETKIYFDI